MTDIDLEQLRALVDALPSPLIAQRKNDSRWIETPTETYAKTLLYSDFDTSDALFAFLVAARDAVPALLDALAEARAEVERMREADLSAPVVQAERMRRERDAARAEVKRLTARLRNVERMRGEKSARAALDDLKRRLADPDDALVEADVNARMSHRYLLHQQVGVTCECGQVFGHDDRDITEARAAHRRHASTEAIAAVARHLGVTG